MKKDLLFAFAFFSFLSVGAQDLAVRPVVRHSVEKSSGRPEGESKLWTKASWGYQVYLEEYALDMVSNGSVVETIEDADGNVWFNNPTIGLVISNWYKAEKDGSQLVVRGAQKIAVDPDFGRDLYVTACEFYEDEWMTWYRPTENQEFRYDLVDGKIVSADKSLVLGLCYMNDDGSYSWAGYGDYDIVMTEHTAEPMSQPKDVEMEMWTLSDGGSGHMVKVGFEGDNVYVGGILPSLPDTYIKGEVSGNMIVFGSGQYLGIDTDNLCDAYFIGSVDKSFYNEYGEYVVMFDMLDSIAFAYDSDTKKMTAEGQAILVNAGTEYTNKVYSANNPTISRLEREKGALPMKPEFIDVMWYDSDFGFGVYAYTIPNIDVNGYPLDVDRLYYEVFYNGEEVEFYPDECPGLSEPTVMIPYGFYDNIGIYGDETGLRTIIYYSYGVDTISMRTVFVEEDGTELRSEMATIENGEVKVESAVADRTEISRETFDLQGHKVSSRHNGIVIEKVVYDDGSVVVGKRIVRH